MNSELQSLRREMFRWKCLTILVVGLQPVFWFLAMAPEPARRLKAEETETQAIPDRLICRELEIVNGHGNQVVLITGKSGAGSLTMQSVEKRQTIELDAGSREFSPTLTLTSVAAPSEEYVSITAGSVSDFAPTPAKVSVNGRKYVAAISANSVSLGKRPANYSALQKQAGELIFSADFSDEQTQEITKLIAQMEPRPRVALGITQGDGGLVEIHNSQDEQVVSIQANKSDNGAVYLEKADGKFGHGIVADVPLIAASPSVRQTPAPPREIRMPSVPTISVPFRNRPLLRAAGDSPFDQLLNRATIVASDGTFLGLISADTVAQKSIMNTVGKYGSNVSADSIFNDVGRYGGEIGRHSPWNDIATDPPGIYLAGEFVAYLTVNTLKNPRIDPRALVAFLKIQQ